MALHTQLKLPMDDTEVDVELADTSGSIDFEHHSEVAALRVLSLHDTLSVSRAQKARLCLGTKASVGSRHKRPWHKALIRVTVRVMGYG